MLSLLNLYPFSKKQSNYENPTTANVLVPGFWGRIYNLVKSVSINHPAYSSFSCYNREGIYQRRHDKYIYVNRIPWRCRILTRLDNERPKWSQKCETDNQTNNWTSSWGSSMISPWQVVYRLIRQWEMLLISKQQWSGELEGFSKELCFFRETPKGEPFQDGRSMTLVTLITGTPHYW